MVVYIDAGALYESPGSEAAQLADDFLRALSLHGFEGLDLRVVLRATSFGTSALSPLNPFRLLWNVIAPLPWIYLADYIQGRGERVRRTWRRPRLEAIPLGISETFANRADGQVSDFLAKYRLSAGYLLYVGGASPAENLEGLLYAYAKLALSLRPKLLILQRGVTADFADLKELATQININFDLLWIDDLAVSEWPALFYGAALLLFPSLGPGRGLPILQALACGRPVLAAELESWRSIGAGAVSYTDFARPQVVAERIEALLQDENRLAYLGDLGLKRVKAFEWGTVVRASGSTWSA